MSRSRSNFTSLLARRHRDHQLDAFRIVACRGCSPRAPVAWHRNYFNLSIYAGITVTNYYPLQLPLQPPVSLFLSLSLSLSSSLSMRSM